MRLLVVVDMQEDFIRGALTVPGAEKHRVSKDKLEVIITSEIDSSKSITVVDDLCDGGGTFFVIHKPYL